jgi:hypothetical protein
VTASNNRAGTDLSRIGARAGSYPTTGWSCQEKLFQLINCICPCSTQKTYSVSIAVPDSPMTVTYTCSMHCGMWHWLSRCRTSGLSIARSCSVALDGAGVGWQNGMERWGNRLTVETCMDGVEVGNGNSNLHLSNGYLSGPPDA